MKHSKPLQLGRYLATGLRDRLAPVESWLRELTGTDGDPIPLVGHRGFGAQAWHRFHRDQSPLYRPAGGEKPPSDPAGYRENTLPSFDQAVAAGFRGLELDLRLTGDRQIVVYHDPRVGSRRLEDMNKTTLEETLGYSVPWFSDVLMKYGRRQHLFVELKKPVRPQNHKDYCREVARLASEALNSDYLSPAGDEENPFPLPDLPDGSEPPPPPTLHFMSFYPDLLRETARFMETEFQTRHQVEFLWIAVYFQPANFHQALDWDLDGVLGHFAFGSRRQIDLVRSLGLRTGFGIINHPRHIARLRERGADYLFTDNARLLTGR